MAETTRTTVGDFLVQVSDEIKKVTWPDREQLRESTIVIVAFVAIVGTLIFLMDRGVILVLDLITSLLGG
ncbi:MAG TPA: preprotein translocase subunit SecE [Longimicrobiaceae bacterium]|jgi:preprotein translocase subunit SecE|nr:preprotein translocase subunit SecE [Longimicrobiaceae bacterium]